MINKMEKEAKRIANLIVSGDKDAGNIWRDYISKTHMTNSELRRFNDLVKQYEYHLRYGSGVY